MSNGAGGGKISVAPAAVRQGAKKLRTEKDEIDTKLRALKKLVNGMVKSDFVTAKASPKFEQDYVDWNKGATKMMDGLRGMSDFLDKAVAKGAEDLDSSLAGKGNK